MQNFHAKKIFFKQQFVSHSPCLSKFFNWCQSPNWFRTRWKGHWRYGYRYSL